MRAGQKMILAGIACAAALLAGGCVERTLTVHTRPPGAVVYLNDEEVGNSPVTVSFNWYGDYKVRITKPGYQTFTTHRKLRRPWYDHFPFDFFAQCLSPKRIEDRYQWTFPLEEKRLADRQKLIEQARDMRRDFDENKQTPGAMD